MKKLLAFLNLLDNAGNLSISNIAVIVCLVKMALSAQLSGCDLGALLGVLLNYGHKRFVSDNAQV